MVLDIPGGAVETGEHAVAAFRYTLPPTPVAGAAVDIDHVAVTIELLLRGELDVLVGGSPGDQARAGALTALRAMAKGLMVRGLGSATPSVSATAGHRFTQRHHDFRAPSTVTFAGDCAIDFSRRWDGVDVTVTGDTRYSLEVTALPTAGERAPADETPRGWFLAHEKELASIGLVLLVAVPITPALLADR